ncbi:MAG TPA: prepilin-type N-terminal cleavage/methylation domain-containing protein [Longimicrobium sp.]|jgi:prepilin-type N-terminal cleavage/methylation domain-containing protein|nr:prepilin-type N-terminal cleavage/methylation domain-containing protein [Longimicrobium sp.]
MTSPSPRGPRAGFTLLEVVVALAVSGLVLLGARVMLEQVADGAERIAAGAAGADRDANAERSLRDLVSRIEVSPGEGRRVVGDARGVSFSTWCDVPAGWQERCTATLGVVRVGEANVLALASPGLQVEPVRRGFERGSLLYLADPGEGGAWVRAWDSAVSSPLAIGVVIDADTLILRIGERG